MVGADVAEGRGRGLTGVAHEDINEVLLAQVAAVGSGVLLLPYVGLTVTRAADALCGQTQRGVGTREVVLRQFLAVQIDGGLQREVANGITCPDVRQQVVIDVFGHTLLKVVDGVGRMVANSEVGILVGVGEVVGAVGIIDADDGRHQEGIDKTVGDASRVRRRVEDLLLGGGQALLLRAAVGGVDAKLHVLLQLPLHVGVEVVALETGVQQDAVLVGIVGREGIAALIATTRDAQLVTLLNSGT